MKESKVCEGVANKSRTESAMLGANKSSHVISKSYVDAKTEGRSSEYSEHKKIIAPIICIRYVYEPKIIRTDPQNFRSLVQKLTGNLIHKSKEKKRQTSPKNPSTGRVSTGVGTYNPEDTFYNNDQISIGENKSTNFWNEDFSGFPDMLDHDHGFLQEIPLVRNNSPFL